MIVRALPRWGSPLILPRRAAAVAFVLLVLAAGALAGCLSPGTTSPSAAAPSPDQAATPEEAAPPSPARARVAELPECGVVVWGDAAWSAVATNARLGLLMLGSSAAPAERLAVVVWRQDLEAAAASFAAGGGPELAAVPGAPRVVSDDRVQTEDGEERWFVLEGHDGGRDVRAWVRLLAHGNATLIALARAPSDATPSEELMDTWRGVEREGLPREACARPDSEEPPAPAAPDASGRVLFRAPGDAWGVRHPANWSVDALSDSGEAFLLRSPAEGAWDDFRENVMVVHRRVDEAPPLEELESELVRQLREKFADFNLTRRARTLVDGEPALRLESTETHAGTQLRAVRVIAVKDVRLVMLEAQVEPLFGDAQENDVESVLASFRWAVPPPA